MSGPVQLIWSESLLDYRLSEEHPLQPIRVQLAVELIRESGLIAESAVIAPRIATEAEIGLCHSPEYIRIVQRLSRPSTLASVPVPLIFDAGFGTADNPIADGMHYASAEVVGASLTAAEAVHSGSALHVFSPAGGLHHAHRSQASGFCVYNDIAVACAWLRAQGHRVACVDIDVHHGDGTQDLFYSDPEILTISLHESGRYLFPGTGFPEETGIGAGLGAAANLPLLPYAWDEPWLAAFEAVVPPLVRRFKPTVLVTQCGCDTHLLDPLAHLQCSTRIWPQVGRRFHELAHELCEGRWLATGGGGYAIREVVPRAWTLLFAEMVERPDLAASQLDLQSSPPLPEAQERIWKQLVRDVAKLGDASGLELVLPAHA